MKKWIPLFLCVQLIVKVNGQQPAHNLFAGGSRTGGQVSFLPVFFHREGSFALPGNGSIREQLNNRPLFASTIRNGRLHGAWQSWFQNGLLCDSGNLYKGLPDGVWKQWDEYGRLISYRTYSAGKYQRVSHAMLRYHPKIASYPLATLYSKNRKKAMHLMSAQSSFPGSGAIGGLSLKEIVTNNITAGKNYGPVFSRSLHHGLFMNFFPGGTVKDSGFYQNGLRHGLWVHVDQKGEIEKGVYQHGIKVKEWRVFNASGKIKELTIYSSSGKIRKKRYFK